MKNLILKMKVLRDTRGQDLIEYALMAGFVAVAAGAVMPGIVQVDGDPEHVRVGAYDLLYGVLV